MYLFGKEKMEIKTVEELKDAIDTCDQAIDGLERAIDIFVSPNFFPEHIVYYQISHNEITPVEKFCLQDRTLSKLKDFLMNERNHIVREKRKLESEFCEKNNDPLWRLGYERSFENEGCLVYWKKVYGSTIKLIREMDYSWKKTRLDSGNILQPEGITQEEMIAILELQKIEQPMG